MVSAEEVWGVCVGMGMVVARERPGGGLVAVDVNAEVRCKGVGGW